MNLADNGAAADVPEFGGDLARAETIGPELLEKRDAFAGPAMRGKAS
jgi:hypothetical protein